MVSNIFDDIEKLIALRGSDSKDSEFISRLYLRLEQRPVRKYERKISDNVR